MKKCCRCLLDKQKSEFGKAPSKDGLMAACKQCVNARRREQYDPEGKRNHYSLNREEIRARQAAHYQMTRDHIISKQKERYNENRQAILSYKKDFHFCNRDRLLLEKRGRHRLRRGELNLLKSHPCTDCGGTFPPACMDFDHRPGTHKASSVSSLYSAKRGKLQQEIAKCDLVCKVCHRIRTANRRPLRKRMNPALELRLDYLTQLKKEPCSVCGKRFPPEAMDLHHIDPTTKHNEVAQMVRIASMERLKAEVLKCSLLCANCHYSEHFKS